MTKIIKLLTWLDKNLLFYLSAFLIIFIPLFPKIPLFEILPGYIVRARAEDVLIFITALIWIKDAIKKRFPVKTTYLWIVIAYTTTGIMSILLGTILLQSIPSQLLHIGKSGLHLFRYLEYFSLFFFLYSSVKTKKQIKVILSLISISVTFIVFYGFGQTYLNFPLYSTMNREYSKGVTLYLQEGARPQSTFAGHYDLAAYLVVVLPIIFSLALSFLKISKLSKFKSELKTLLQNRNTYVGLTLHIIHLLGAWMLVISGSKTALFAYFVALLIVLAQYVKKLGTFKQQFKWGSISLATLSIGLILFLNFFAKGTRDKFISILRVNPVTNSVINKIIPKENSTSPTVEQIPDDLIGDGHEFKQITVTLEDGTKEQRWVEQKSDWSPNALKYGISMGIRLDTLWPNALLGFFNMPVFGNGYATLAAINNTGEFTFAESTDNNFLRTLGETGFIGFILFYGFILVIFFEILKNKKNNDPLIQAISVGYLAATVGLLINATYIDVFASSKVAYTFWAISGLVLAINSTSYTKSFKKISKFLIKNRSLLITLVLMFFILHRNPFHKQSAIQDLNISDTQIETLVTSKCFIENGSFSVCRNSGLVLKDNFNLYSLLLVPFMKVYDSPLIFYILNVFLFISIIIITNKYLPIFIQKSFNKKPRSILILGSSLALVLIIAILQFNQRPLTSFDLLMLFVVIPFILFSYTFLLHKLKFKMSYLIQISMILALSLVLINQNIEDDLLLNFRNNTHPEKNFSVDVANIHFDNELYLNRDHDFYLVSGINPYYFDFFGNGNYKILPLSDNSKYIKNAPNVYDDVNETPEDLIKLYEEKVKTNSVFVTNYGVNQDPSILEKFDLTKKNFDLKYITVGCEDLCNLYQLNLETPKISKSPKSVNSIPFSLASLKNSYSFSIIPNKFEPLKLQETLPYNSKNFTSFLNQNVLTNFVIVSGDLYSDDNKKTLAFFESNYRKTPVLYNKGNTKLDYNRPQPSKNQYFYTDTEFFIMLDVSSQSTVSAEQQLLFYNALLELEKLPNIKTIFVIANDLDWENKTQPNNFIFDLEKKLSQFPEITKYIITDSHAQKINREKSYNQEEIIEFMSAQTLKHVFDETKNIHYLTASVKNWPNDSFLEFAVNQDKTVRVNYRFNSEQYK